MEKLGLTPAASRVLVYLLFCDKEGTFEEIVAYFKMSKSAVSNAINYLISIGLVDFKTQGGKRKRYFSVDFDKWISLENISFRFKLFWGMLDEIQTLKKEEGIATNDLEKVSSFYRLLLAEMPIIMERWKNLIENEPEK